MPVEYSKFYSGHEPQDNRRDTYERHHQEDTRKDYYQSQEEKSENVPKFKHVKPKPQPRPVGIASLCIYHNF